MTSKERVLAAVEHRQPDILPVGFKATDDVLDRLRIHFDVEGVKDILDNLPVDTYGAFNNVLYGVYPTYIGGPPKVLYPNTYPDNSWDTIYGFKRHWVGSAAGRNDELMLPYPLLHANTVEDLQRHAWPQVDWFDYSTIAAQCEAARDYAVIFNIGGLGTISNLIGRERVYVDMYLNPEGLKYALNRLMSFYLEFADRVFQAANGGIDIALIQDDFGTQRGPLMSMESFREFWKPLLGSFFELSHAYGIKTMMHSCGAVFDFIPDFIEIGADILDPVQTNADGMNPGRLNKEFGKEICFHGGIDTQNVLVTGTPDDVRQHIDWLVESFSRDGGFVLAPSHYVQDDVPTDNLLAMFDRISELRGGRLARVVTS